MQHKQANLKTSSSQNRLIHGNGPARHSKLHGSWKYSKRACEQGSSTPWFNTCQIVCNTLFHSCASRYGTRMSFTCLRTRLSTRLNHKGIQ